MRQKTELESLREIEAKHRALNGELMAENKFFIEEIERLSDEVQTLRVRSYDPPGPSSLDSVVVALAVFAAAGWLLFLGLGTWT